MTAPKLNILYMIHGLSFGGAERQFVELVRGMASSGSVNPIVCSFSKSENGYAAELIKLNIPIFFLARSSKLDIRPIFQVISILSNYYIDLIHSFSPLAGLIAVISGGLKGIPVIGYTIQNSQDTDWITYVCNRFQAIFVTRFVANSYSGLINRFNKMRKNFSVVYNGVDFGRFTVDQESIDNIQNKYNLKRYKNIITMIATMGISKDYDTLIKSIPEILEKEP